MPAEATPDAASADSSAESTSPSPLYTHRAVWLVAAAVVAGLWWFALGSMAVRTANPVTVNVEQVRQSRLVIEAVVVDDRPSPKSVDPSDDDAVDESAEHLAGVVRIEKSWFVARELEMDTEVEIANLWATAAEPGGRYVMPLAYDADEDAWAVTTPRLPGQERDEKGKLVDRHGPALIYPATDEAREQLEAVLKLVRGSWSR